MNNYANGNEIPLGLGMALAQNLPAMHYFSEQTHERQRQIIGQTHEIQSKEEMRSFVASLISGG